MCQQLDQQVQADRRDSASAAFTELRRRSLVSLGAWGVYLAVCGIEDGAPITYQELSDLCTDSPHVVEGYARELAGIGLLDAVAVGMPQPRPPVGVPPHAAPPPTGYSGPLPFDAGVQPCAQGDSGGGADGVGPAQADAPTACCGGYGDQHRRSAGAPDAAPAETVVEQWGLPVPGELMGVGVPLEFVPLQHAPHGEGCTCPVALAAQGEPVPAGRHRNGESPEPGGGQP